MNNTKKSSYNVKARDYRSKSHILNKNITSSFIRGPKSFRSDRNFNKMIKRTILTFRPCPDKHVIFNSDIKICGLLLTS